MSNYCTLFDSKYLSRGLVMIKSLQRVSNHATIYVLCMDEAARRYLDELRKPGVVVIGLNEFETEALLTAKLGRTKGEYCWTCTPSLILHCITRYGLPACTYVDADLYFYRSPENIFERMDSNAVLITPHRYSSECDRTKTRGTYCVQFMVFRATEPGLKALTWWRDRCLEWCFARVEDGKFGDQKYLDDWPTRFGEVYVADEADVGVAPWNIQLYEVTPDEFVENRLLQMRQRIVAPVFYHFHGIKFWRNGLVDFGTNYRISTGARQGVYRPYVDELLKQNKLLTGRLVDAMFEQPFKPQRLFPKMILWTLRGTRNIFVMREAR
jgi:hypothetical protein